MIFWVLDQYRPRRANETGRNMVIVKRRWFSQHTHARAACQAVRAGSGRPENFWVTRVTIPARKSELAAWLNEHTAL